MSAGRRIVPRRVFSVLERQHRDVAVADAVAAGLFDVAGEAREMGAFPDWLRTPLPADKEWRIEWVKFYYGLDLAHAFTATGDRRYVDAWRRLVGSWLDQVPPGSDDAEVVGRRIQNWIYAWNRFCADARFGSWDDGFAERLVEYLSAETAYVRDHLTRERNHRTLELYALLVAALALPDVAKHESLARFALHELGANLLCDVRPDGVHREASTHYHCVALRSYVGAAENARRFGLELPHGYLERLARACEFAMHCHRPDGRIPAFSDADSDGYHDVLALAATLLDRDDLRWVASSGARGSAPRTRYASFPEGGYYIQRSGWGEEPGTYGRERFLMFDCGPIGDGGHGHYDLLSVEVSAQGAPLLVDAGRYTYDESPPNWRRWFKGTAAHNTVVVDRLDQTPYRRRRPRGDTAVGRLLGRFSAPGLDVVVGAASSPRYEVIHTRAVVFVADEYWLVLDELTGDRPHEFDLRWHLSPEAGRQLHVRRGPSVSSVDASSVTLVCAPSRPIVIEPGWYAPTYGRKVEAPVASVRDTGRSAVFVTAIVPHAAGQIRPAVDVRLLRAGTGGRRTVQVRIAGPARDTTDLVTWAEVPVDLRWAGLERRARAALARFDRTRDQVRLHIAGVDGGGAGPDRQPVVTEYGAWLARAASAPDCITTPAPETTP